MFVFFSKKKKQKVKVKVDFKKKLLTVHENIKKKKLYKKTNKKTTDNVSTLYFEIKKQN